MDHAATTIDTHTLPSPLAGYDHFREQAFSIAGVFYLGQVSSYVAKSVVFTEFGRELSRTVIKRLPYIESGRHRGVWLYAEDDDYYTATKEASLSLRPLDVDRPDMQWTNERCDHRLALYTFPDDEDARPLLSWERAGWALDLVGVERQRGPAANAPYVQTGPWQVQFYDLGVHLADAGMGLALSGYHDRSAAIDEIAGIGTRVWSKIIGE